MFNWFYTYLASVLVLSATEFILSPPVKIYSHFTENG